ncbi:MAG: radical SAM family heme chaperone HemW [Verrucomicrobia bacterium]|nr:radical SAM family heme chaperone HemW [Verrucomicrobiota bacterium]
MMTNGRLGIYFHLPFCTKKCPYCHFYVLENRTSDPERLLVGLRKEWALRSPQSVETLYFGGGTPSLMGPEAIKEIISWMPNLPSEITLEVNPEDASLEKMRAFYESGVNRISLGVQTLDDNLLKAIGRTHSAKQAMEAVENSSRAGFENISIDLMLELPAQTLDQVRTTFSLACSLPITHLSLYNLVCEPPSLFYKRPPKQPLEEEALEMHLFALQFLKDQGFERYEISAFARDGKIAQHNTLYWTGAPFLGFGPSAFSYIDGQRFRNTLNWRKYFALLEEGQEPVDFRETLDTPARQRELLAVELRLLRGVHRSRFEGQEKALIEKGLLELHEDHIRLTDKGLLFYDTVASELI